MLSGITITCFAASYAVSLALEVSRLFFRAAVRFPVLLGFSIAGLFAHAVYLGTRAEGVVSGHGIPPLSSWYDFCLVAAWALAGAYVVLTIRRPQNALGIFLLPLVLLLIGVAVLLQDVRPFNTQTALYVWRLMHSFALMTGTTVMTLGFATGLMYLIQAYRLKHKLPPRPGFQLPSLEWLQDFNRESLVVSTCLLGIGFVAGVVLNLIGPRAEGLTVSWTDPIVLSSGCLFLWLAGATAFETLYTPARQGKKVAYLTVASFVFLGLALYFVLFGKHAVR
jgi:hypothetical protein